MSKTIHYRWMWETTATPDQLWPHFEAISHRLAWRGIPAPGVPKKPANFGPASWLFRGTIDNQNSSLNIVQGSSLTSEVAFISGHLRSARTEITINKGDTGSIIRYDVKLTPRNIVATMGIPFSIGISEPKRLEKQYKALDKELASSTATPATVASSHISKANEPHVNAIRQRLTEAGYNQNWVGKLVRLLANEPDKILAALRPFHFADLWGAPRRQILDLFISAAAEKMLTLQWLIDCPHCGGGEATFSTLTALHAKLQCPRCEKEIEINAATNLELTFQPDPTVRKLHKNVAQGHPRAGLSKAVVQRRVDPDKLDTAEIMLAPGRYRIRAEGTTLPRWQEIEIGDNGQGDLMVCLDKESLRLRRDEQSTQHAVAFRNTTDTPQRFLVEDVSWKDQRAFGIDAFTCQTFRTLFANEVPADDTTIKIPDITLLLTRILPLAAGMSDEASFMKIRDLFKGQSAIVDKYDGAMVNILQDASVAAFGDSKNALDAAIEIRHDFHSFTASLPSTERLGLKIVLHQGSCVAVNLNNLCDFFGQTITTSNTIRDLCPDGDMLVSDRLSEALNDAALNVEEFEAVGIKLWRVPAGGG